MTWLIARRRSADRIDLILHPAFRIVYAVIGIVIAVGLFSADPAAATGPISARNTIPLVFLAISILAVLYHERWVFDRGSSHIRHELGLLPAHKVVRWPADALTAVELRMMVRGALGTEGGRGRRRVHTLALAFADGEIVKVDSAPAHGKSRLESLAEDIGRFYDVSVISPDSS